MIGCPPSTVNVIVNKYKLRSETPCVVGLDGKKYRQRKRKAVAGDTTNAGKSDTSVINDGAAFDMMALTAGSDRPFDKMRVVLGLSDSDDSQRVQTYLGIVKDMVAEGFSEERFQQEFMQSLESEFFKK